MELCSHSGHRPAPRQPPEDRPLNLRIPVETWQALAVPRRAVPMLLVGLPMLAAEWYFTRSPGALVQALALFAAFAVAAPAGWRMLFPMNRPKPWIGLRVLLYGALGAGVVALAGLALPTQLSRGDTFLTDGPSLLVILALFWVGGWGLGRDIDLEAGLKAARQRVEAERRARERAALLATRAHLDPHFLFNTLNAIAEWISADPAVAESALLKLAGTLRTLLSGLEGESWPLERELELVDDVLELHHIRDPERFTVRRQGWDLAPAAPTPPLVLLPLIENAMKHGPSAGHTGGVLVAVSTADEHIQVTIENPGPYAGPRAGGQGLELVRRRLELAFPDAWSLDISGQDTPAGPRTRAIVRYPFTSPTE